VDIGSMDPEDILDRWLAAKWAWDEARGVLRRRQAEAVYLTGEEQARLDQARAQFDAAEQLWDEAYRAGVVVQAEEPDDGTLARLEAAVAADPLADEPRLAYADAVRATDDERAGFIEMQIAYTRNRMAGDSAEQRERSWRSQMLADDRGREWVRSIRNLVDGYGFFRGFAEAISMDAAVFLARAPRLYRLAPVLQLYLTGVAPVAGQLFASPCLGRIRGISMLRCELGDREAALIAGSPHLGELRWLELSLNQVGEAGLEALAASENLPRLGWLGLSSNAVEDPTPRHADEYDCTSAVAKRLQQQYGPRDWLNARPRAEWPPHRDAYADDSDL
jgi:uncharacterized protein (TIGR02996 family)